MMRINSALLAPLHEWRCVRTICVFVCLTDGALQQKRCTAVLLLRV